MNYPSHRGVRARVVDVALTALSYPLAAGLLLSWAVMGLLRGRHAANQD